METKLFHGDIETVEIPEGGLELAPGIIMRDDAVFCGRAVGREVVVGAYIIRQSAQEFHSLRTLFLRQPSEDEE